ncbi:MAG: 2-oxoacid:acceptor oxidoreductase subunit alpha [Dehalococcoidia bacterium]
MEINIMVAGEAGQGVQSVGFLLAQVLARSGYHVFADQDYESRIRGGHNFFRVRAGDSRVGAISQSLDILIALNEESIRIHSREVRKEGKIVFDEERVKSGVPKSKSFGTPLEKIAVETTGKKIAANTVALAAALGIVGADFELLEGVLRERFKSGEVADENVKAARQGYDHALEKGAGKFPVAFGKRRGRWKRKMLINGNEAIAMGALAAGCKFISAYPMTPATTILEFLTERADEFGLVAVQPEDEIAAINMAVGAGYAGLRAMTATSGSGFCLMVEGLGWAGITETPIVVVDAQRPGPAVGLPTRTEQADLQFALHAHHGDFPRVVIAPSNAENAFWLTVKAFNIAERYQLPVILLTDHYLASSYTTVEPYDTSRVHIDRGELYMGAPPGKPAEYQRHRITRTGISPRALPGRSEALVITDSDEHDETGHLTEDAKARTGQVEKRLRKLEGLRKEISGPPVYGSKGLEVLLVGWGSSEGPIKEAVDMLQSGGMSVNMMQLTELWPFPARSVAEALEAARYSYVVEGNASGQMARLIKAETGRNVTGRILRYDGRPLTPEYIAGAIEKEVSGNGPKS